MLFDREGGCSNRTVASSSHFLAGYEEQEKNARKQAELQAKVLRYLLYRSLGWFADAAYLAGKPDQASEALQEASGLYRDFYIELSDRMEKFDEVEYIGEDNLEWVVKVYDLRVPEGENACDMEDPSHKNLLKMTFDQMVTCETTYGYKS